MAYTITVTYTAANDIFNAKKEVDGIVTPCPIPGLDNRNAPSDAYIYAPEGATKPVYNKENIITIDDSGNPTTTDTYKTASYLPGSQRRWAKNDTKGIMNILEAYATPQIPVYRAWQTIKLAITSGTYSFEVATAAESEFYKEAGKALTNYGIVITSANA